MQQYQARVIEERSQLREKQDKLLNFIAGDKFDELGASERSLMMEQSEAMLEYSNVLNDRIKAF